MQTNNEYNLTPPINIDSYSLKYNQLSTSNKEKFYQQKCAAILNTVLQALQNLVAKQASYEKIQDIFNQTWSYIQLISKIDPNFSYIYLDLSNKENTIILKQIWSITKKTVQDYRNKNEDKNEDEENINIRSYQMLMFPIKDTENIITFTDFPALFQQEDTDEDEKIIWSQTGINLITIADIKKSVFYNNKCYLDPLTKNELTLVQLTQIKKRTPNFYACYQDRKNKNRIKGKIPKDLYIWLVEIIQIAAISGNYIAEDFKKKFLDFLKLERHSKVKVCYENYIEHTKFIKNDIKNIRNQYSYKDDTNLDKTLVIGFLFNYTFDLLQQLEKVNPGTIEQLQQIIINNESLFDLLMEYKKNKCMNASARQIANILFYLGPVDLKEIVATGEILKIARLNCCEEEYGAYSFLVSTDNSEVVNTASAALTNANKNSNFIIEQKYRRIILILFSLNFYLLFLFLDQVRYFLTTSQAILSKISHRLKKLAQDTPRTYREFFGLLFTPISRADPLWSRILISILLFIYFPIALCIPLIYLLLIIVNKILGLIVLLSSPKVVLNTFKKLRTPIWLTYSIVSIIYIALFFIVISFVPLLLFTMHSSALPLLSIKGFTMGSTLSHFIIQPLYTLLHLASPAALTTAISGWMLMAVGGLIIGYLWNNLVKHTLEKIESVINLYRNKITAAVNNINTVFPPFSLSNLAKNLLISDSNNDFLVNNKPLPKDNPVLPNTDMNDNAVTNFVK